MVYDAQSVEDIEHEIESSPFGSGAAYFLIDSSEFQRFYLSTHSGEAVVVKIGLSYLCEETTLDFRDKGIANSGLASLAKGAFLATLPFLFRLSSISLLLFLDRNKI
ncbi:MAG: hypothetical protein WAV32_04985 [Halobacteriota archaeon]